MGIGWATSPLTVKEQQQWDRFMAVAGDRRPRKNWESTMEGKMGIALCAERIRAVQQLRLPVRGRSTEDRLLSRLWRRTMIAIVHDTILATIVPGSKRLGCKRVTRKRRRRLQCKMFTKQDKELQRKRLWGSGRSQEDEMDTLLYSCYISAIQALPIICEGEVTEYITLSRAEFQSLTRKKQLREFWGLGRTGRTLDDIIAHILPVTMDELDATPELDLPVYEPGLSITELLQLRGTLVTKIKRLRQYQGELRRNAKTQLRKKLRQTAGSVKCTDNTIGGTAVTEACSVHRAVEAHRAELKIVTREMKKMVKKTAIERTRVFIPVLTDASEGRSVEFTPRAKDHRDRNTRNHKSQGGAVQGKYRECGLHGSKPAATDLRAEEGGSLVDSMTRNKKNARRALKHKPHGARREGDTVGGFLPTAELRNPEQRLTVCTLNVAGMDEIKLDIVLQHMEEFNVDVMVCIDVQLSDKSGRYLGRKAKTRLGTGSVVHTTPCATYTDVLGAKGVHRKVGGIMIIVGCRWGSSIRKFDPDWLGKKGGSAGVLAKLTLCTEEGDICVIGSYWPISHAKADLPDKNLWKLLQAYIDAHGDKDRNPTELIKRMVQQWVHTSVKNGALGAIVTGDLNSTWGAGERGGQQAIRHWAGENSFINGPLQIGEKLNVKYITRGLEAGKGSWIDHMLHKGRKTFIDAVAAYTDHGVHWEGITDHRPLWTTYIVPPAMEKVPQKIIREQIRWELPLNDRRLRDAFVEGMDEVHVRFPPPAPESEVDDCLKYVAEIERRSGILVKKLHAKFGIGKARSTQKDGWSPRYMADKIQLGTLVEIRRHLTGAKRRRRWSTEDEIWVGMGILLDDWEEQKAAIDLSEDVTVGEVEMEAHGLLWWRNISTVPTVQQIDDETASLKKRMHGKARSEARMKMNGATLLREQMRKDGFMRPVIKSLLGILAGPRHQDGADLAILRKSDGRTTSTAAEGHMVATEQLRKWFASPMDEAQGIHTEGDWEKCMTDERFFLDKTSHTGVPEELRKRIFEAVANVAGRKEAEANMLEMFEEVPTYDEWTEMVQGSHNNSSGGMSGCSYNQMKMWPEGLSRGVYSCLARMWTAKCTPVSWKWRWLVPIPKNAALIPSVEELRPLILVEAVRKVWSKLILKKLKTVWHSHPVLNESQHGYRAARSTMTASLLHLNLLEDTWHSGKTLHSTSWDMSKAFDSVSKNMMRIAWRRVGVPLDVTEWLVNLDVNGTTVVRTPYAVEQWNQRGYNSVIQDDDIAGLPEGIEPDPVLGLLSGFHAERGTGQGDVTSPTCWNAVFDILLTALHRDSLRRGETRTVQGEGNLSYMAHETAYADDMHSGVDTASALQNKADLVSAYCLITGLQLSVKKLRRFIMAVTGETGTACENMVVYGKNWVPVQVQTRTEGCLKYLGGLYDVGKQDVSALREIKEVANTHCAEVAGTRASATTKLAVVTSTTIAKVRYKAKLTTSSLAELRQVDKIFYKFHRKITKNMNGFPYDLMYLPSSKGGVGIDRFTDQVQIDKLGMLFKGLLSGGELANATRGMLQRAIQATDGKLAKSCATIIRAKKRKKAWIRSILEWLEEAGLFLCRGGEALTINHLYSPIRAALSTVALKDIQRLEKLGIYHLGDMIDDSTGCRQWYLPVGSEGIRNDLPTPPTQDVNLLWKDQFWVICGTGGEDGIVEIVDILNNNEVRYHRWETELPGTDKLIRNPSILKGSMGELFPGTTSERCDVKRTAKNEGISHRRRVVPTPVIERPMKEKCPSWIKVVYDLVQDAGEDYRPRLFTDGSYVERANGLSGVFDTERLNKISAGSIVIMHEGIDWKRHPTIVIEFDDGQTIGTRSAYSMEFLALTAALQLQEHGMRGASIGSDAAAVVSIVKDREVKLLKPDCSHRVLLQSIRRSISLGAPVPKWVPSHPERRIPDRTLWQTDDWGNHWADRGASGDYQAFVDEGVEPEWIRTSAKVLLQQAIRTDEWYIGDSLGAPIALNGIMHAVEENRLQRYLEERDRCRDGPPRWVDSTIPLAAEVYNGKNAKVARAGQSSRIVFNKHWHGGNRMKQRYSSSEEAAEDAKCHMCGGNDSQDHWIAQCLHPDVAAARSYTLESIERTIEDRDEPLGRCRLHDMRRELGRGILAELQSGNDSARVWTSCWSEEMISRIGEKFGSQKMSLVAHKVLRKDLVDIGRSLATGARDILQLRQNVASLAELRARLGRERRENLEKKRQKKITDWISHGKFCRTLTRGKVIQHGSVQEVLVSGDPSDPLLESIINLANSEAPDGEIVNRIGHIPITLGSIRALLSQGSIDDLAINGYMSLLNQSKMGAESHCLHTEFYETIQKSANLAGSEQWDRVQHYTKFVDIFLLQKLYVPIFSKSVIVGHWTQVIVDFGNKQITHYDTAGVGGVLHARKILDYVEDQWRRTKIGRFQRSEWSVLESQPLNSPQQSDSADCGVFMLTIAQLQHMGASIENYTIDAKAARRRIVLALSKGEYLGPDAEFQLKVAETIKAATTITIVPPSRTGRILPRGGRVQAGWSVCGLTEEQSERIGNYNHEKRGNSLYLSQWDSAGIGLYTAEWIHRKTIIGHYTGKKIEKAEAEADCYESDYVLESHGITVDAWDPDKKQATCLMAFINDSLDLSKVNVEWCRVKDKDGLWQLAVRALRDIGPDEQLFAAYGAQYWCSDKHSKDLQCKAMQAYWVDIEKSTEHTDGLWRQLANYNELLPIFLNSKPSKELGKKRRKLIDRPTDGSKKGKLYPIVDSLAIQETASFHMGCTEPTKKKHPVDRTVGKSGSGWLPRPQPMRSLTLPSLTDEETEAVRHAWAGVPENDAANISKLPTEYLHAVSLHSLSTNMYINDDVINYYGALLNKRNKEELCVGTFFFDIVQRSIREGDSPYRQAQQHLRVPDIFAYKKAYFPIHYPEHWTTFVVNLEERIVQSYDTLFTGRDTRELADMVQFLKEAYVTLHPGGTDNRPWKTVSSNASLTPHQGGTVDCGAYVLLICELMMNGDTNVKKIQGTNSLKVREYITHHILTSKCYKIGEHFRNDAANDLPIIIEIDDGGNADEAAGLNVVSDQLQLAEESIVSESTTQEDPGELTHKNAEVQEDEQEVGRESRSKADMKTRKVDLYTRPGKRRRTDKEVMDTTDQYSSDQGSDRLLKRAAIEGTKLFIQGKFNKHKDYPRRSTRTKLFQGSYNEDKSTDPAKVESAGRVGASTIPGAGLGLFATKTIKKGDIVTRYGKDEGLTINDVRRKEYHSDYLVIFADLIRDEWDHHKKVVTGDGGRINDPLDRVKENVVWALHDTDIDTVVLRATRDIDEGEEIFVEYGGHYWCSDKHSIDLLEKVIRRYNIDIRRSTRETQGEWINLLSYDELIKRVGETVLDSWSIKEEERGKRRRGCNTGIGSVAKKGRKNVEESEKDFEGVGVNAGAAEGGAMEYED